MNLEDYDSLTIRGKVEYFESLPDSRRKKVKKLVYGMGVDDGCKPNSLDFQVDGKRFARTNPVYDQWRGMLERCYSEKFQKENPTYVGTTVCDDWLTFSNFHEWWEDNYVEGWQLDKDILSDNKQYSPDSGLYVPCWLNNFTIDSGKARGQYRIGVYWSIGADKFQATCNNGGGKNQHLGYFDTELEAHLAWREYKLNLALKRKAEMDEIDTRIYPRIVEIINRLK